MYKTKRNKTKRNKTKLNKTKRNKTKGGTLLPENTSLITPTWRHGNQYWSTVLQVPGLELYGSSIPSDNELACFNTFTFYMFRLQIRKIVSLHACSTGLSGNYYCRAGYHTIEDDTWNAVKILDNATRTDPNYTFTNSHIGDMSAGPIQRWLDLIGTDYTNVNDRTLIHCAGGYGRTCSVLTMLSLNRCFDTITNPRPNTWPFFWGNARLNVPFLGLGNSLQLYNFFRTHFLQYVIVSREPNIGNYQNRVNRNGMAVTIPPPVVGVSTTVPMADELFRIDTDFHANLFLQRVNRWILCWAINRYVGGGVMPLIPNAHFFTITMGVTNILAAHTPATIFNNFQQCQIIPTLATAAAAQNFFGNQIFNAHINY
jgi:hypothetical protein